MLIALFPTNAFYVRIFNKSGSFCNKVFLIAEGKNEILKLNSPRLNQIIYYLQNIE